MNLRKVFLSHFGVRRLSSRFQTIAIKSFVMPNRQRERIAFFRQLRLVKLGGLG